MTPPRCPRETWVPEVLPLVGDPKIHGEPVVLAVEADGASSRPGPRARPHLISAGCDFNGDEDAHTYAHEALIHRTRIHRLGFPCQEPWRIGGSGTDLNSFAQYKAA